MRKGTIARKLSAVILAGALAAFAGLTASAEVSSVSFSKTVNAGENVLAPETSFKFAVAPETVANGTKDVNGAPVYAGVPGGASFAENADTITFTPGDELTKSTDISLNASAFTTPGIYRYKVTENGGTYDGMTYSSQVYYLDLYVINGASGPVIDAVVVLDSNGDKIADGNFNFTNTYTTNKLSVKKVITGNQANKGSKWDITVTVSGAEGEKYSTNKDGVTLTSGTPTTVSLGNNEELVVNGLSGKDVFTVVEDKANTDGYTTTYTVDNDTKDSVSDVLEGNADKTVVITNSKDVITPTGIVMSIAPYILLVALAGALAVLFLRRRREEI